MTLSSALVYAIIFFSTNAQTTSDLLKAEEQQRLNACLTKQREDPQGAYEDGLAWLYEGNRPMARYCTATALIEIGHYAEGAARLEELAAAPEGGTLYNRSIYLAQAGNAWLLAGLPEAAIVTLTDALKLTQHDPEIYLDRARAYLAQEEWEKGMGDLDRSISIQPGVIEPYLLRAEAHLQRDELDKAMSDVDQARAIDDQNIEALLLRGRIREAQRLQE